MREVVIAGGQKCGQRAAPGGRDLFQHAPDVVELGDRDGTDERERFGADGLISARGADFVMGVSSLDYHNW